MAIEHRILVAGFNYENPSNPMFLQSCNNRMTRFLQKGPHPENMVFTLFDVAGGTLQQSKVDPKTKRRDWTKLKTFTPVTTANYSSFKVGQENHFDTKPAGVISVTDVYSFVQDIGNGADKGTVEELNFFSHGWMGGPILVNSFEDDAIAKTPKRDPNDKDARTKDFNDVNMNADARLKFNAAFSGTGFVWTWGCSFARVANIILSRLFSTPLFRRTPWGKLKDTDKFTLDFSDDAKPPSADDDFNAIVKLLPGGRLSHNSYTVTVTLKQIKDLYLRMINATYTAVLSGQTGISSIGALPGTYADGEKKVPLPQMIVPQSSPPYDDNLSRTIKFYTTYMAVFEDPENRGYGQF